MSHEHEDHIHDEALAASLGPETRRVGGRLMSHALYQKELQELERATKHSHKRNKQLFDSEGKSKYSVEEHTRRFEGLIRQFDMTARKVLKKANKRIEAATR